jgi:hypothetical protein
MGMLPAGPNTFGPEAMTLEVWLPGLALNHLEAYD